MLLASTLDSRTPENKTRNIYTWDLGSCNDLRKYAQVEIMTMDAKAVGRVAMVSMHLMPHQSRNLYLGGGCGGLHRVSTSSLQVKKENNYEKVHGGVSSERASWRALSTCNYGLPFLDIIYEKANGEGIAKITINRPEKRNAFRPQTIKEMMRALNDARDDIKIGVIILTGKGNDAFCSGGDQSLRGPEGYADTDSFGRLNVLDLQVQIRRLPKPVIAMVAGYAVGGGNVLHMVCDITIAADNAVFGQTGPKVGSFDAGYGCSAMSHLVGTKRAREMWFLSRFYGAKEAMEMGLINTVVPLEKLEQETMKWCREILRNSPTAIRVCKAALNAVDDGHAGLHEMAGNATLLFYGSEEANEGKTAYLQRRKPDFSRFPRLP